MDIGKGQPLSAVFNSHALRYAILMDQRERCVLVGWQSAENCQCFVFAFTPRLGTEVNRITAKLIRNPLRIVRRQCHFLQRDQIRHKRFQLLHDQLPARMPSSCIVENIQSGDSQKMFVGHAILKLETRGALESVVLPERPHDK